MSRQRPARFQAMVRARSTRTFRQVSKFGQEFARELVEYTGGKIMQEAEPNVPVDTGNLLKASSFILSTGGAEDMAKSKVRQIKKITTALRPKCDKPQWETFGRVLFLVRSSRQVLAVIGFVAPYAHYVHDGTKRMAARPFLANAVRTVRGWIPTLAKDAYRLTKWRMRI